MHVMLFFIKMYKINEVLVKKVFSLGGEEPLHPAHWQFEYNTAKAPPTGASQYQCFPAWFITHLTDSCYCYFKRKKLFNF